MKTQTATEMRKAFINTLRSSQSVKQSLTAINERHAVNGVFQDRTECVGVRIGERITYADTKPHNSGLISTKKQGWLFSAGEGCAQVWDGKNLVQVGI